MGNRSYFRFDDDNKTKYIYKTKYVYIYIYSRPLSDGFHAERAINVEFGDFSVVNWAGCWTGIRISSDLRRINADVPSM